MKLENRRKQARLARQAILETLDLTAERLGGWLLDHTGNDYTRLICITVAFYLLAASTTWYFLRKLETAERARLDDSAVAPNP